MENKHIPGVLKMHAPSAPAAPVVFDSPHSGTDYPDDFRFAIDKKILRKGEDTYIHELYDAAPGCGATLIEALFPRAYIDPNRPEDDIDQELMDDAWPDALNPSIKSRSGIGLIWRLAPPIAPIYDRKLTVAEVQNRIAAYHRPYFDVLTQAIEDAKAQFGQVWHINCHSMPNMSDQRSPEAPGTERPDFCLGDRDQTTCDPAFTHYVKEFLEGFGYKVNVNDPYKGVELVKRYGRPGDGFHSLQIEVNRRLHLNEDTKEKNELYGTLHDHITQMIEAICAYAKKNT